MNNLHIAPTTSTPLIDFDASANRLQLSGESYPENSFSFYAPVIAWIRELLGQTSGPVEVNINMSYLNTSSTKCIIDILDDLEASFKKGIAVTVNWYYDEENDRAAETAEEFKEDVTMPFNIIAVK